MHTRCRSIGIHQPRAERRESYMEVLNIGRLFKSLQGDADGSLCGLIQPVEGMDLQTRFLDHPAQNVSDVQLVM